MNDLVAILLVPAAACVVLTGIHCYLGIHVVMRQVIFVDLALAQIAAVGTAAGLIVGIAPHTPGGYACSLGFTIVGAAIFALGRFRDQRVHQEAIIGIVYAVSSAVSLLILSRLPTGPDEVEHMLVGRLLFVDWPEIGVTAAIYVAVAAAHVAFFRKFLAISRGEAARSMSPAMIRLWDFIFYALFGIVVTSSVQIAGVLLVFGYLVVPATGAMLFLSDFRARLLAGWALGLVASLLGLGLSAMWDLPTGGAVVAALGAVFACCAAAYVVRRNNPVT